MGHGGRTVPAAGPGQQTEGWSSTRWPAGAGHAIHDAGRVQRLLHPFLQLRVAHSPAYAISPSFTTSMT